LKHNVGADRREFADAVVVLVEQLTIETQLAEQGP
jgi:hypothetical protein